MHDDVNRERFALRRAEQHMAAEEKALEREIEVFGEHLEQVEQRVEATFRKEHWGHEPERPLSWR